MGNKETPAFNLTYEKWIAVRRPDGSREEVSMLELFKNAPQYLSLAGEVPAQDIAMLRLLLAILHSSLGGRDIDGIPFPDDEEEQVDCTLDLWEDLWNRGFPYGQIEAYLKKHEDRFWLFHPETPFYQVAGMNKGTDYAAAKLNGEMSESGHKLRLFPQRAGRGKVSLSYQEAARWLLYVIGFDDTAAKPTQKGLPSPGAGWLGKLGLITAVGDNLFRTLMLNLVLLPGGENKVWGDDRAIWEELPRSKERVQINKPNSQAALLTLQSRRILLKRENDAVTGYILQGGDFFPKENAFVEQMTVWRNSSKDDKAPPEYVPSRHNPAVQMWRGFSPLVEQSSRVRPPGVISWLRRLKKEGKLKSPMLCFQIDGVKYGDKDFFVEDVFVDSLTFNAALLAELHKGWVTRIISELAVTDSLVREVGTLAQCIAKATGDENGNAARDEAKLQAYYRLDRHFREWLESINPEADNTGEKMDAKCEEWWITSRKVVLTLGKEIVNNCSPQAMTGRNDLSAPKAMNWFLYNTKSRETLKKKKGSDKSGKKVKTKAST